MEPNLYWAMMSFPHQPLFLSSFPHPFLNPYHSPPTIHPPSQDPPPLAQQRKQRRQYKRRNETELNKCFKCPYQHCFKDYASDLALNLHMKNKHRGGNKKDRDRVAKMILKSEMMGKPVPKCDIQLPPGYIKSNKIRLLLLETEDENEGEVKKEE